MEEVKVCHVCGKTIEPSRNGGTGYGVDKEKHIICYDCCTKLELDHLNSLKVGEKTTLYLSKSKEDDKYYVSNWTSGFSIPVKKHSIGEHNMAGIRRDVWFEYNNHYFHGTQYGNFSELCHIKRIKTAC